MRRWTSSVLVTPLAGLPRVAGAKNIPLLFWWGRFASTPKDSATVTNHYQQVLPVNKIHGKNGLSWHPIVSKPNGNCTRSSGDVNVFSDLQNLRRTHLHNYFYANGSQCIHVRHIPDQTSSSKLLWNERHTVSDLFLSEPTMPCQPFDFPSFVQEKLFHRPQWRWWRRLLRTMAHIRFIERVKHGADKITIKYWTIIFLDNKKL